MYKPSVFYALVAHKIDISAQNRVRTCINCRLLTIPKKKAFKSIVSKAENAGNQHFLLFPSQKEHLLLSFFFFFFVVCKYFEFGPV